MFSVSVPMNQSGVDLLAAASAALAAMLEGQKTESAPQAAAPAKAPAARTRNTAPKAAAAPAPAKEEAAPADPFELILGDEAAAEEDELGLDTPPPPPAKTLTLADDVIPAFRAALGRVGDANKDKLGKVLAHYKVNTVHALPADKYAEVIAKLSKIK